MSLRAQLEKIYNKHGKLTPKIVLEEARNKKHPLHGKFPWDDHEAAELHRLAVAHELITSVRISYISKQDGSEKSLRGFHAIRMPGVTGGGGYSYEPLDKVTADPFLTEIVLRDMQREWQTLRRRYEDFSEFWQMVSKDLAA